MKNFQGIWMIAVALVIFTACGEDKKVRVLPLIGQYDIEYKTVDGVEIEDTIYPTIPSFTYLNQDSTEVTAESMKGKIWVADFFFSTCPTICPTMTTQMKRLQAMTKDLENDLQFISFSINPSYDQPTMLRRYIKHHGITANNWQFLTGDEAETHELGVKSFLVHVASDEEAAGGYAHSPAFTLVDKEGIVRGVYIGTDTKDVDRLEKDLRKLLKYEYGVDGSK
ncbi:MAG: SCO family protein [Crocinitomicaceae bacterium]|nr:SCO family protein [Flavobacteriales bacterium]NQZ35722.1 SCO family protein [Crocinitomicaceae bacterium]